MPSVIGVVTATDMATDEVEAAETPLYEVEGADEALYEVALTICHL